MNEGHLRAIEALVKRNAEACENARAPVCVCGCGGALHGKAHSAAWCRAQAQIMAAAHEARELQEQRERRARQPELPL
jgi:hypothetical protein